MLTLFLLLNLAAATEHRITTPDGVGLQYVSWGGEGEPLILLPGGCDTAWIFGDIAPQLAKHSKVYSLTPRGCGASGRPESGYSVEHHVADVAALMDSLQIERADLAGHSLGGGKITQFALKYPKRVHRLIYFDTAFGYVAPGLEEKLGEGVATLSTKDPMESLDRWKQSARLWDLGAWSPARDRNVEENFTVLPNGRLKRRFATPPNSTKDLRRDLAAGAYSQTKIDHPALMIFSLDTDRDRIKPFPADLRQKLLPLVEETQKRRKAEIAAFRANGKHVQIVELRHTAHYCFVHRPETILKRVNRFLTAVR